MPLWFRKFIVDFVETGLGAVLAVVFVVPQTTDEALKIAAIFATALAGAAVSAFRRAIPGMLEWLRGVLGVPADE